MVEPPLKIDWSFAALGDLERFASFLREVAPELASSIAGRIADATRTIGEQPFIGRPIAGASYRKVVLRVSNATYILQYRIDGERIVILRVFHGRENRGN